MLKAQDILVLAKIIATPSAKKSFIKQMHLARELFISVSSINESIKRLTKSHLLGSTEMRAYTPIITNCSEFFIYGVPYIFPPDIEGITCGMPTSYSSPFSFNDNKLWKDDDPVFVWPYCGEKYKKNIVRGSEFRPIYPTVPRSLDYFPNDHLYEILAAIDLLRSRDPKTKLYRFNEKSFMNRLLMRMDR